MGTRNQHTFKPGHTAQSGEDHPMWKGEDVSYQRKHQWVRYWFGEAMECEHCGTTNAKKYDWANISGLYKRDSADYIRLCRSCHKKYDHPWTKYGKQNNS